MNPLTIVGSPEISNENAAELAVKEEQLKLEVLIAELTGALQETQKALKLANQVQADKTNLMEMFEQAPGFVALLKEPAHVFELANRAFSQLVAHRNLVGKPIRNALPELAGQGVYELLDKVYRSQEPYIGNAIPVTIQTKSGAAPETIFLDFIYQPILDTEGKTTGIFVQGHNVTEQKIAQDELKLHQQNLEALVSERTKALEETRAALHQAQKLESIGKLTGGVAHDFNNVLQIISGNLQLLEQSVGNDGFALRHLNAAIAAVERGEKLSSQLLAFARRQPLRPIFVHLGKVVQGMDELLRQALGEAVAVEIVVGNNLRSTLVDPNMLENAVLNLAINASDAMNAYGRLTLEIANVDLDTNFLASALDLVPGPYVMLAVTDTGSGMSAEVVERAVEPFFTTKPAPEGTGLGLSMVYGFVKQSGGHFKIVSEIGKGTCVRMYFPSTLDAETKVPEIPFSVVEGGNETILIVEDDAAVQVTVAEMLTQLGYRVLKADSADEALPIVRSGVPIDLLFTDVVMPGKLRSSELAEQAKVLIPGIQVLYTSGYAENSIVKDGQLSPSFHFLTKPYHREQLAKAVRELLSNRASEILPFEPNFEGNSSPLTASHARILVVEDGKETRYLICEYLKILGNDAHGVVSAEEAIKLLREKQFDILFTDFSLPGMNGVQLAKLVKKSHPTMKIIFASGYGKNIGNLDGLDALILSKPYDFELLREMLELLSSARSEGEESSEFKGIC